MKPVDVYKAMIDQLVERSPSISGRLVRDEGIYTRAQGSDALNKFVASLTAKQRELLAAMLDQERSAGFHDVLADLTWWIATRDVALTWRGEQMPVELSEMGLHGDYIGRLSDWEWPSDDDANRSVERQPTGRRRKSASASVSRVPKRRTAPRRKKR